MDLSPTVIDTPEQMGEAFTHARNASRRDPTPDAATRITRLKKLEHLLRDHLGEWETAVAADFGHRSPHETRLEAFASLEALAHSQGHLKRWMRPQRRPVGFNYLPGRAEIRVQPLGVIGIIVPWNYPIALSFGPIIDALAAGNRVLVKMSDYSPHTTALFARIASEHFTAEELSIVGGDLALAEAFSSLPFDHLLFTGSGTIGRRVMRAAADNLTPVTLELGGKTPLLIAPDYPIEHVAARIVAGKCLNAGQTCIAPDYVLTPKGSEGALIVAIQARIAAIYPNLCNNPDYSNIINARQYARLEAYVDDARAKGADIVELCPGQTADRENRRFPPLAVLNARQDMELMQEEIFGPLLPILPYETLDEAIAYINAGDRPLAMYVFDRKKLRVDAVLNATTVGGVTINDVVLHLTQNALPFGGVGPSGMGSYHGHHGFLAFSKQTGVFWQARWNGAGLISPPYNHRFDRLLAWLMR